MALSIQCAAIATYNIILQFAVALSGANTYRLSIIHRGQCSAVRGAVRIEGGISAGGRYGKHIVACTSLSHIEIALY